MDLTALAHARSLDAADPLASFRDRFVPTETGLVYLDGNSLGRPTSASAERVAAIAGDVVQALDPRLGGRLARTSVGRR